MFLSMLFKYSCMWYVTACIIDENKMRVPKYALDSRSMWYVTACIIDENKMLVPKYALQICGM